MFNFGSQELCGMYAIIEDGSHQFRVREGDRIRVDRRDGNAGDELTFTKVLLISGQEGSPKIGTPAVEGAHVIGKIVNQFRAKKIIIQKFRRRKNMRRRNGHRQPYTMVQITSLVAPH
jgi:large subunit ribosomal protein L21